MWFSNSGPALVSQSKTVMTYHVAKRTRAAPLESGIEQRVFATGRRSRRGPGQSATISLYVPKHDATLTETYLMLENWLISRTRPVSEGHLHGR